MGEEERVGGNHCATADAHLISDAIIMCGHERTVCWCCEWQSVY